MWQCGRPEITTKTFWDVYLNLLEQLHDGSDKELTNVLNSHQSSAQPDQEDMALLPNMEPFCLGHPIDVETNTNYVGGLDVSAPSSSVPVLHPEYADFTSDKEGDEEGDSEWPH